jgi:ubiquinone/menaquinone biosynthesis C-methylase UbiE
MPQKSPKFSGPPKKTFKKSFGDASQKSAPRSSDTTSRFARAKKFDTTKVSSSQDFSHKTPKRDTSSPSSTSWGTVASWYDSHLEKTGDTYHEKVVYPNLLRILGDIKGKKILDLACGQGQFSRIMQNVGAYVTGVDLGKELITLAESHNKSIKETGVHKVTYFTGSADDLYMIKDASVERVVCVLALQNIENLQKTIEEAGRVLVKEGSFIFVLNHPSFRNPRQTHWGYDEAQNKQYRRIDEYMSESHVKIDMTPGSAAKKKFTVSFHRPLQVYVKALTKQNFVVTRLEEWVSHRESEKGPKQKAENVSRKEIPLFMCIEVKKLSI